MLAACFTLAADQSERVKILERAATLIEQNDLQSAESTLTPLLATSSDDAVALNLLGLIRVRQGKLTEAEHLFRRAIETGHPILGPHVNLARLYAADRPLDALHELKAALNIAPGDEQSRALVRSITRDGASDALRSARQQDALALVSEARDIQPKDAELLYIYGMVAFQSELYRDAQVALEEALQIRPGYSEAQYALARVYLKENLAQRAENEMRRYLATKPNDATAQYGLGYILVAEQKLDDAKAAFERSLALEPQQTESLYQVGEIALEQGQSAAAQQKLTEVLSRDPHHAGALTGLGVIAFKESKYPEAKRDLEQAIAAAPGYQKAHYYYALTLSKIGDKERAAHEFEISKQLQEKHLTNDRVDLPR